MNNFLTQESKGKVMALLGTALVSLSFMFAITLSHASFTQVYNPLPDPFSSTKVVAMLDYGSKDYSDFLNANLFMPAQQSYALAADNIAYINNALSDQMLAYIGAQNLTPEPNYLAMAVRPEVAGDYTSKAPDTR